jgi:hypothetical protein
VGFADFEAVGLDAICERIIGGETLTSIAKSVGCTAGQIVTWVAKDEERLARTREARAHAAKLWDEKAERAIEDASDPFELSRAKELAHHYRWRASKAAPKDYGDKQQIVGDASAPLQVVIRRLSDGN